MTLNDAQRAAIGLDHPMICVMSGPGSGKTLVATERVKRIEGKTVVLTYTNAAAREFRSRIEAGQTIHKVAADPKVAFCGTLHSYCFRLLRKHGHILGYHQGLSILPEQSKLRLLEQIRNKLGYKNKVSIEQLQKHSPSKLRTECDEIIRDYRFELRSSNLVDYDLILDEAAKLLMFDPVKHDAAIDHLIVDEAQDSAGIDWVIYGLMPTKNHFFIGDIDQAIFEFRKATPEHMLGIQGAQYMALELNYRCRSAICAAANRLIRHNKVRYDKETITARTGEVGYVDATGYEDQWAEAEELVRILRVTAPHSNAVLCRTNYVTNFLRQYLEERGFKVAYDRPVFLPPDWNRAMLLIGMGLSPYNEGLAEQYLLLDHPPDLVHRWKLEAKANGTYLSDRVSLRTAPPVIGSGLMRQAEIAVQSSLRFLANHGVSNQTITQIEELRREMPEDATLGDLLQELNAKHWGKEVRGDGIFVGTIHSAKGREFDHVFLPAFEDFNMTNIEEERRLAFVALTRARYSVRISWAKRRKPEWGEIIDCKPSRFLKEIMPENEEDQCRY